MPSSTQHLPEQSSNIRSDAEIVCSSYTSQSKPLPSLCEDDELPQQQILPTPFIRVPSSTSEVDANAAAEALTDVIPSTNRPHLSTALVSVSHMENRTAPFGNRVKPAQRRTSDVGVSAPKAYQPMLSPAAKACKASLQVSALYKTAQSTNCREKSETIVASRSNAGQMLLGGKGKSNADTSLVSQAASGRAAARSVTLFLGHRHYYSTMRKMLNSKLPDLLLQSML